MSDENNVLRSSPVQPEVRLRAINVRYALPEEILVPENWKNAQGVEDFCHETNSALAKRDYNIKCDTGDKPLVVVEGYHIWWCKTHHQPYYKCEKYRNA